MRIPTAVALALSIVASPAVCSADEPSLATDAALAAGFVENRGQEPDAVRFHARQGALHLWATDGALVLGLPATVPGGRDVALHLSFAGEPATLEGRAPLAGRAHFLRAGDASVTDVPLFGEVLYTDLAPGLDLRLRQTDGRLEYDLELAPGTTLDGFQLRIAGADALRLESPTELVVETAAGPLVQTIPAAWQVRADGAREPLGGRFVLGPDGAIGFALEGRDPALPAVLDPVLTYAGYVGGSACDFAEAIALDTVGRAHVAGISQSADFPTTPGVIDTTWLNDEAFVVCYDAAGTVLRYATFLGGSGDERARDIFVDDLGERVWLAGETESADFPVTPGAYDVTKGDFEDAFVARISGDGAVLDWATFLGGGDSDRANAIDVEATGRVFVVGTTSSSDFPVTVGVGQPALAGGSDAFVAKLAATGASLLVSSYFGGSSDDAGTGVARTFGSEIIFGGTTRSDDLSTTLGAVQPARAGGEDGFVGRMSLTASLLVHATYVGGSGDDAIHDIATWPAQTVYAVGVTESPDFPTTPGALSNTPLGLDDAFISVVAADAGSYVHSTYLGGSGNDAAHSVALDPVGTTYVVGTTGSTDLPVTIDAFQSTHAGGHDLFHFIVSSDGSAIDFGTYYGGPLDDAGYAMAHDDFTGNACFAGHVLDGVATSSGVHDPTFNGGSGDGFSVCYTPVPCPTPATSVVLGPPCSTAILSVPPLVQGSYITLAISGAPPNAPGLLYTSPSGATPILWEGICNIWVDIFAATPFATVATDSGGNWSLDVGLPNDAPRCGKMATFQALVIDVVGGPLSFGTLTNGVECTFGS